RTRDGAMRARRCVCGIRARGELVGSGGDGEPRSDHRTLIALPTTRSRMTTLRQALLITISLSLLIGACARRPNIPVVAAPPPTQPPAGVTPPPPPPPPPVPRPPPPLRRRRRPRPRPRLRRRRPRSSSRTTR